MESIKNGYNELNELPNNQMSYDVVVPSFEAEDQRLKDDMDDCEEDIDIAHHREAYV